MSEDKIDNYIKSKPKETQGKLIEMRRIIKSVLPLSSEAIKWGNPAFIDSDGMILVVFAGYNQHMNLAATPSTVRALASELSSYKTGKGSIQFPYDQPLPRELIKQVVTYRSNEYKEHGIKWM